MGCKVREKSAWKSQGKSGDLIHVLIHPVVVNSVKSLSNTGTYIANSNVASITSGLPQTE